jgi:secondary thiamine-phosphate synthase enzyme
VDSVLLDVLTSDRLVTDVTAQATDFCRGRGDGLLHLFVPHATAGIAVFETGAGSEDDLELILESMLPRGAAYTHRHGSPGHGRDHVLPAFVSPSMTVPVISDEMQLGTWQSLVIVDSNVDNRHRHLRLSFLPG